MCAINNQNMTCHVTTQHVFVVILMDYVVDLTILHIFIKNELNITKNPSKYFICAHKDEYICTSISICTEFSHVINTHQVQCVWLILWATP